MHTAGTLKNISMKILKQSRDLLSRRIFPNLLRLLTLQKLGGTYFQKYRRPLKWKVKMENQKTPTWASYLQQLVFSNGRTYLVWSNYGPHQPCRSTRVWLETFRWSLYRDCNRRQHSSWAATYCAWMQILIRRKF